MFADFVEIGTSDFDTEIQKANDSTVGLSIEPIQYYLDRLPNPINVKKINMAISSEKGTATVYYMPEENIIKHGFGFGLRGCNSIDAPHPIVSQHIKYKGLNEEELIAKSIINKDKLINILHENDVKWIYYLKIDTEGHDLIILNSFFQDLTPASALRIDGTTFLKNLLPHRILFESNLLSKPEEISKTIELLKLFGYEVSYSNGTDTLMYLNIHRIQNRERFSAEIKGYYLAEYPNEYNPHNAFHDNTLESAQNFCKVMECGGVTYQNNKYEIRKGNYLFPDPDKTVSSWIYY